MFPLFLKICFTNFELKKDTKKKKNKLKKIYIPNNEFVANLMIWKNGSTNTKINTGNDYR